jgi:hypothetical protein
MAEVVLDRGTLAKLDQHPGRVKVMDETGRVRGYFTPIATPAPPEPDEPTFSPEEITRLKRQTGGRPLADILVDWKIHNRL